MELIIFLVLALGSTVSAQKSCQDLLGNCHQMPTNLCTDPKSQKQMRSLCAKTCGYCPQVEAKTKTRQISTPFQSPTDIFLLYLKNDVKFLKEEIVDIKQRLRDVTNRQRLHWKAISKGTITSSSTTDTNESGSQIAPVPQDDTLLAKEVLELKRQAQRLTARIQDQNDKWASLDSKFNQKLSNANGQVSEKMKNIRGEIASLSNDLKKYAEQIEDLSDVDDELASFKVDSESRSHELRRTTILSIEELKNFTTNTAQRFLSTQTTFYAELGNQRQKNSELETRLNNLEQAFRKEQKKTADLEQLVQVSIDMRAEDDGKKIRVDGRKTPDVVPTSPLDGRRLEELTGKFARLNVGLVAQTKRTDILTTLVAALSNNLSNVTTEQRNIRRYLAYQYAYIGRHMKGLVSKLNQLETFSQEIINRTLSKVSAATSTKEEFSQLSSVVYGIFGQLKSLRMKGFRTSLQTGPVGRNASSGNRSVGLSAQNLEVLRDMSQDIDILKKKVAYGAEWVRSLDSKVQVVSNKSADGIAAIKKSIQDMAVLRNNESISLENINSKFQQGIAALLGPQRSNTTRFFNPRFDWETSKLAIYGYVAMNHGGEWGTICDDNFDDREAEVLCRLAGYKGGVYDGGKYKVSDGKINGRTRTLHRIWIDELHCDGTENAIEDCQSGSEGWGIHDCDHDEDIGIKCYIS